MEKDVKKNVKETYGKIAKQGTSCCGSSGSCCSSSYSCCNGESEAMLYSSKQMGYSEAELESIPSGADLGLGCGNPVALASLEPGETVLDLGSGPGMDCFLAAGRVGETGKVIGVDMTPEMIEKARNNAAKGNYGNVEFRLGEIENLPVDDNSVNAVISNCVINLCPDKARVFSEVYRVLKPSGRMMVSDIVLEKELTPEMKNNIEAYVSCVAGASLKADYLKAIENAGFSRIEIAGETVSNIDAADFNAGEGLIPIISLKVSAYKLG